MSFKEYFYEQEENSKQEQEDKVMGAIIDFFSSKEKPTDDEVHDLAEELGIDKHQFEEKIYAILSSFFNAGRYKENPVEPDAEELKKGIDVEMEHTTSPAIARRIALDHLAELNDYYTKLAKMEGEHE
jgi:hypothetical protein